MTTQLSLFTDDDMTDEHLLELLLFVAEHPRSSELTALRTTMVREAIRAASIRPSSDGQYGVLSLDVCDFLIDTLDDVRYDLLADEATIPYAVTVCIINALASRRLHATPHFDETIDTRVLVALAEALHAEVVVEADVSTVEAES